MLTSMLLYPFVSSKSLNSWTLKQTESHGLQEDLVELAAYALWQIPDGAMLHWLSLHCAPLLLKCQGWQ